MREFDATTAYLQIQTLISKKQENNKVHQIDLDRKYASALFGIENPQKQKSEILHLSKKCN